MKGTIPQVQTSMDGSALLSWLSCDPVEDLDTSSRPQTGENYNMGKRN